MIENGFCIILSSILGKYISLQEGISLFSILMCGARYVGCQVHILEHTLTDSSSDYSQVSKESCVQIYMLNR